MAEDQGRGTKMKTLRTWPRLAGAALLVAILGGVAAAWWFSRTPDNKTDVMQAVSRDLVEESTFNESAGGGGDFTQNQADKASTIGAGNKGEKKGERPKTTKPTIPVKPAGKPRVEYLGPPAPATTKKPKS
jgi:hypothetical protein